MILNYTFIQGLIIILSPLAALAKKVWTCRVFPCIAIIVGDFLRLLTMLA